MNKREQLKYIKIVMKDYSEAQDRDYSVVVKVQDAFTTLNLINTAITGDK